MIILWIYEWHDAAACIMKDWKILVNIEKERLSREKHDRWNVMECIQYCLDFLNMSIDDIDYIATSRTVRDKAKRAIKIIEWEEYKEFKEPYYSSHFFSLLWKKIQWYSIEHHLSHAASSYYLSWYDNSWILVMDWYWDFTATMILKWEKNKIIPLKKFNTNLWRVRSEACTSIWLNRFWEAWTLMALGTLWKSLYKTLLKELYWDFENFRIDFKKKLSSILEEYYNGDYIKIRYKPDIHKNLLKLENPYYGITEFSFVDKNNHLNETTLNFSTSLQSITDDIVSYYINLVKWLTKCSNICYSWWVALNCVSNTKIRQSIWNKRIFIPPFCNDSWLAIGNALFVYYNILDNKYSPKRLNNCYLWREYLDKDIELAITTDKISSFINYEKLSEDILIHKTVDFLLSGKIIWWFQWRSESWPRALWNRSIICNPWYKNMKWILNDRVKHRQEYRPFAPSVLLEEANKWFDIDWESPFMLYAFNIKTDKKDIVPSIVHIDGTARVQTVNSENNNLYYKLILEFYKKSWIPIILDTSFNDREPMVETPFDALKTFLTTNIDICVIWNYLITKK